jgi:hypothetical protein
LRFVEELGQRFALFDESRTAGFGAGELDVIEAIPLVETCRGWRCKRVREMRRRRSGTVHHHDP